MKNGLEDYYVIKNNKKLRYGYTTGSCAAAAAKAAARMLLTGEKVENIDLMTPKGILLHLEILDIHQGTEEVSCAVRKDGGDDPDATHGLLVYAAVCKKKESGVDIDGGRGVGRVTKKGLEQPVSGCHQQDAAYHDPGSCGGRCGCLRLCGRFFRGDLDSRRGRGGEKDL